MSFHFPEKKKKGHGGVERTQAERRKTPEFLPKEASHITKTGQKRGPHRLELGEEDAGLTIPGKKGNKAGARCPRGGRSLARVRRWLSIQGT